MSVISEVTYKNVTIKLINVMSTRQIALEQHVSCKSVGKKRDTINKNTTEPRTSNLLALTQCDERHTRKSVHVNGYKYD